MKYFFEVKSYRFVPENYREQRTAMHYSDFSGHKKQYQLLINGAETQLTWVKGFNTFAFQEGDRFALESKEPSKWLCVEPVTEEEISSLSDALSQFFSVLSTLPIDAVVELNVPTELAGIIVRAQVALAS